MYASNTLIITYIIKKDVGILSNKHSEEIAIEITFRVIINNFFLSYFLSPHILSLS